MKSIKDLFKKKKKVNSKIALQGGSYTITISAIVLAILVVVNVLFSKLPSTVTSYDISASQLYSITSSTKVVVNNLEKDVTIYWVVQADKEDSVIENLLDKYESLSSHISVVKKNPDTYPTFTSEYTSETVANNSLIVECGDKYRYIAYSDIYLTDVDYTTYSYSYSFDGEGAVTSAISYVTSDDNPKVYLLQGHGESDLPSEFSKQVSKQNIETDTLSLLNIDEIPEDADAILIYAPTSDISDEEASMLEDYLDNGGKVFVSAGPTEDGILTNLYSVLSNYGVDTVDGIVVESDRNYYSFSQPYMLLPTLKSDDITDPLINENYYVIFPIAQGLTVTSSSNVTTLLESSSTSFSKAAGYSLTTYDKEDGDIDGSFALAVSISTDNDGELIWFSSSYFLEDVYNSYSSGANLNLATNALSELVGKEDTIAISSKSLKYNYLTISDSNASKLKAWMIGIVPGAFVLYGIITVIDRRRKSHA